MKPKRFFLCECDSHAVSVETFDDDPFQIALAFWKTGISGNSLIDRLKYIYRLWRGELFADDVILTCSEAKAFGEYLLELANSESADQLKNN